MQAATIEEDFLESGPDGPGKQLIALYKKHIIGIYNNHIKDIKVEDRDNIPYDKVFNLIDKLREFFAWIYYFLKEQKINPINTTNLTELNKYSYRNNLGLDKYSDAHVEATKNVYIIMEQFAIRDHPLFYLDEYFFYRLLGTNNPCDDTHKYPTHLVFLKHLCSKRIIENQRPAAMVAAYPQAGWMDYPLFFPDGNAHLTDAELLSYSLAPAAGPRAQAGGPPSPESSRPFEILKKKEGGASRSASRDKKVSKSNRITHKKRK
jgi:hypothetical protein